MTNTASDITVVIYRLQDGMEGYCAAHHFVNQIEGRTFLRAAERDLYLGEIEDIADINVVYIGRTCDDVLRDRLLATIKNLVFISMDKTLPLPRRVHEIIRQPNLPISLISLTHALLMENAESYTLPVAAQYIHAWVSRAYYVDHLEAIVTAIENEPRTPRRWDLIMKYNRTGLMRQFKDKGEALLFYKQRTYS